MRLGKGILPAVILAVMGRMCFGADYIYADYYGDALFLHGDAVVAPGTVIDVDNVNITASASLTNMGDIYGNINVCAGCDLRIQNSGTISGGFYTGENASVTQVIKDSGDVGALTVAGQYRVLVDGAHDLHWHELLSGAYSADSIIVQDANLIMSDNVGVARIAPPSIELRGVTTVDVSAMSQWRNAVLFSNVTGEGTVVVTGFAPDALYAVQAVIDSGDLILRAVRETDYYKILGDGRGLFLNSVRAMNPNDATLAKLDRAETMAELSHIMSGAVILNPITLMRRAYKLNVLASQYTPSSDSGNFNVVGDSFHITSSDFDAYGARVVAVLGLGSDLSLSGATYAAVMDDADSLSDGLVYGAGIGMDYKGASWFARANINMSYAKFNMPYVFDGRDIARNPAGWLFAGDMDVGKLFDVCNELRVGPFVGIEYSSAKILHQSMDELRMRSGIAMEMYTRTMDISYNYNARMSLNNDGDIVVSASAEFMSPGDAAGGMFDIAAFKDEDGIAWKISIGAKYLF